MKRKDREAIFIEVKPSFKRLVQLAAELEDHTLADLSREAFKEKIIRLSKKHPQLKEEAEAVL